MMTPVSLQNRSPASHRTVRWLSSALIATLGISAMTLAADIPEQRIEDSSQKALAVTIYNSDLALVKDRREISLQAGENHLAWRDVSARIQPETALLSADGKGPEFSQLEQNFDFDLLTPTSLLEKYVGRDVEVIRTNDAGDRVTEKARVLAASKGVVLQYADRIETGVVGHLSFPDVPENLRDRPTLVLHLQAPKAASGTVELSYLTGGLSWQADYVANLEPNADRMDLNGWVTLTNRSGTAYRNARVQLIAGEVNRVHEEMPVADMMLKSRVMAAAPMPQEESLYEYHLYTLSRATNILDNQTKQVALLSAAHIPVTRELLISGNSYFGRYSGEGAWNKLTVTARLKFVNRDGDLGIPLPAGVVRVYSRDSRGNAQFIGEDRIDHTPKNETITLTLGESFDVTARRRQTDYKKISKSVYEGGFEIELKNAKPDPVTVRVQEQLHGDWTILSESATHTREAADLVSWNIEIPADGSTTLTWTVRTND